MKLSQAIDAADLILVDMYEIETCSTLPDGTIHMDGPDHAWVCPDQELELDQDGETLLKNVRTADGFDWIDCPEPPRITLRVYHGMTEEDIE